MQSDLSFPCVSSRLTCSGLPCDLGTVPHFSSTGLAGLRWICSFPLSGTFRMYLARLVRECQLNDCDATSWITDRVKAAATGLSKSRNRSFTASPAVSHDLLHQLGMTCSLRDEFTRLAALRWFFIFRIKSEAMPTRRGVPSKNMPEMAMGFLSFGPGDGWGMPGAQALPSRTHGCGGVPQALMLSEVRIGVHPDMVLRVSLWGV